MPSPLDAVGDNGAAAVERDAPHGSLLMQGASKEIITPRVYLVATVAVRIGSMIYCLTAVEGSQGRNFLSAKFVELRRILYHFA